MEEHFFLCPYCNANISILIDLSVRNQSYIEDCEVCCNPMQIQLQIEEQNITYFDSYSIEQ